MKEQREKEEKEAEAIKILENHICTAIDSAGS